MLAKSAKVKRYEQRIEQFKQNEIRSNDVPNAEECTKFQGDVWGFRKEHNRETEWLKDLKREKKY